MILNESDVLLMCNNHAASLIWVVRDQPSKSVGVLVGKIFKTTSSRNINQLRIFDSRFSV